MLECSRGLVRCRPQDYTGQASAYTIHHHPYIAVQCLLYIAPFANVQDKSHTGHCTPQSFNTKTFIHCCALQHVLQPQCYHKYSSELKSAEKCHEGFGDFQSELFFHTSNKFFCFQADTNPNISKNYCIS